MAQYYGIILRFQGNGTRGSVEHPSSADLSRTMQSEASKVIGSVEQGIGMLNPAGTSGHGFGGQARQRRSESEGFSLMMTRVSIMQGNHAGAPAPRNQAKITLVPYLSMELHKGDLQLV